MTQWFSNVDISKRMSMFTKFSRYPAGKYTAEKNTVLIPYTPFDKKETKQDGKKNL